MRPNGAKCAFFFNMCSSECFTEAILLPDYLQYPTSQERFQNPDHKLWYPTRKLWDPTRNVTHIYFENASSMISEFDYLLALSQWIKVWNWRTVSSQKFSLYKDLKIKTIETSEGHVLYPTLPKGLQLQFILAKFELLLYISLVWLESEVCHPLQTSKITDAQISTVLQRKCFIVVLELRPLAIACYSKLDTTVFEVSFVQASILQVSCYIPWWIQSLRPAASCHLNQRLVRPKQSALPYPSCMLWRWSEYAKTSIKWTGGSLNCRFYLLMLQSCKITRLGSQRLDNLFL